MAEQPKKPSAKKGPVQGKRKISDEFQEDEIFQAPVITREPSSRQCKLGSNVVLRISATGKPLPSYQWFHNGKKISGANTDRLTISKARRASAGAYHCEAKNHVGKAVSRQCMVSFYLNKVPKLVIEPKDARVEEGKPITLKVVTNNPAEFKEFHVFWIFNGMRIKGARGLELQISAGKKKYEGEYKAMISVGSGIETSNVAKVTIVPASEAAAVDTEHEGTMVVKMPAEEPAPEPEKPADDWNDLLFNPEDDGSLAEESPEAAEPDDKTRDFDSRGIKMSAAEADELLGQSSQLNPIQAIERLKEEIERSKLIETEASKKTQLEAPLKPAAVEQWETFSFEEDEEESVLEMPEESVEAAGLAADIASDDAFEHLSETQKSLKIRELMEQMDDGEEAQLREAAEIAAARNEAKADPVETVLEAEEPSSLVEVVGTDGFTGAIELLNAVEAKDPGEAFDPDPVPEQVAPVKKITDAPARRRAPSPKLAKKREFLESFLARWQAHHSRKSKEAA